MFIFFAAMISIDKRPHSSPAHGWCVSACKISRLHIAPFRRR